MDVSESIIKPKRPSVAGWSQGEPPPQWVTLGYPGEVWHSIDGFTVISAVEVVKDLNDIDKGPEYHVSATRQGRRCTRNEARYVLKAFNMEGSEEDNHVPNGKARHYWLPIASNLIGYECPCKDTETAIKEDKADFIWRGIS